MCDPMCATFGKILIAHRNAYRDVGESVNIDFGSVPGPQGGQSTAEDILGRVRAIR